MLFRSITCHSGRLLLPFALVYPAGVGIYRCICNKIPEVQRFGQKISHPPEPLSVAFGAGICYTKGEAARWGGTPTGRFPIFKKAAAPDPGADAARSWGRLGRLGYPMRRRLPPPPGLCPLSRPFRRDNSRKEGLFMIKIAPSILSADFANLERDIRRIDAADYVHVDVMDGVFVPNISIGIPVVKAIRPTTKLPLDVHLMITQPVRYVEQFCGAGADLVTVHVEADTEENIHAAIDKIHDKGKRAGVVLKPKTPAEAALPFLEKVELILVMTVEPGFGGQKFMEDMMPKVAALRRLIDERNP